MHRFHRHQIVLGHTVNGSMNHISSSQLLRSNQIRGKANAQITDGHVVACYQ